MTSSVASAHPRGGSAGLALVFENGDSTNRRESCRPGGRPIPTRTRAKSGPRDGDDVADAVVAAGPPPPDFRRTESNGMVEFVVDDDEARRVERVELQQRREPGAPRGS